MAEATDAPGAGKAEGLPSTGELLRRARQEKGLTIQQVAQALHLDAWILEALEANRFKDIGAPVFVKGHLKKFAAEVGMAHELVMEAYYRSEDMPETPRLVTDTLTRPAGNARSRGPVIVLSIVLVALIVLVAWLWLREHGFPVPGADGASSAVGARPVAVGTNTVSREPDDEGDALPEALPSLPTASPDAPDERLATPEPETAGVADAGSPAAVVVEQQPPVEEGTISLSIAFANDSWAEIYDGSNRRLFFDLGRAGTRRTVSGEPPLQVLLGNADGARITLNGEAFAIPAGSRRGKTARFSVQ